MRAGLRAGPVVSTLIALAPAPAWASAGAVDVAAGAVAPPDYDDPVNWAAGPGGPGASAVLPAGATPAASGDPGVDVFYVHPTTFRSTDGKWTQDPADPATNKWTDESVVARQASAFSACCRIWSPRYRAASINALMSANHSDPAFALAYSDVERAFDWFLTHVSKGRPFILAGHSQGAKHISDLLEKRVDGTALQDRLVAAYVVGINVAEGEFGTRYRHVPVCGRPAQTGCFVQWNAVLAGSALGPMAEAYQKPFVARYGADAPGRQTVCVNPVTFDTRFPDSLSVQAKGAVPGKPGFGPLHALRGGAVAVRCEQGLAVVYPAPGLDLDPLPGGSMHYHDIGLFYADLRANAVMRAKAWFRVHKR